MMDPEIRALWERWLAIVLVVAIVVGVAVGVWLYAAVVSTPA
jgi:hypothetical protein